MINLLNISKDYEKNHAVKSIDLTMETGKTTVLIGPSGCGKSTILRIIIGLTAPDRGEVHIERDILNPDNLILLRRKMGYVIQEGGAFSQPHRSGECFSYGKLPRLG